GRRPRRPDLAKGKGRASAYMEGRARPTAALTSSPACRWTNRSAGKSARQIQHRKPSTTSAWKAKPKNSLGQSAFSAATAGSHHERGSRNGRFLAAPLAGALRRTAGSRSGAFARRESRADEFIARHGRISAGRLP